MPNPAPPSPQGIPTIQIICPYPVETAESLAWYQGLEAGVGLAKAVIEAVLPGGPLAPPTVDLGGRC
jgi:hypothetical protein